METQEKPEFICKQLIISHYGHALPFSIKDKLAKIHIDCDKNHFFDLENHGKSHHTYNMSKMDDLYKEIDSKPNRNPEAESQAELQRQKMAQARKRSIILVITKEDSIDIGRDSFSLKIFGVPVTYHNPKKRNTFGTGAVKPVEFEWILDGRFHRHDGRFLPSEPAMSLRDGKLESLSIQLG